MSLSGTMSSLKCINFSNIANIVNKRFFRGHLKRFANGIKTSCVIHDNDRQKELMAKRLPKQKPITGVKQILIIASGKGGVGKSTISVNIAVALKKLEPEKEVALLDADVFGPSIPLMMNLHDTPLLTDDDQMKPLINYGVKCMSMGNVVTERSAVMWRGLMVMSALDKLMRNVAWAPVDYMVVDTPPGTGDTHLSLIQNLPITGALIVTTGQKASIQVAKRGLTMFEKLKIPVVGVVHNMSTVVCSNCNQPTNIFGNQVHAFASTNDIKILEEIPIDPSITEGSDEGIPIVLSKPNSLPAERFFSVAAQVRDFLKSRTVS